MNKKTSLLINLAVAEIEDIKPPINGKGDIEREKAEIILLDLIQHLTGADTVREAYVRADERIGWTRS